MRIHKCNAGGTSPFLNVALWKCVPFYRTTAFTNTRNTIRPFCVLKNVSDNAAERESFPRSFSPRIIIKFPFLFQSPWKITGRQIATVRCCFPANSRAHPFRVPAFLGPIPITSFAKRTCLRPPVIAWCWISKNSYSKVSRREYCSLFIFA